jgi:tryptophan-rich sensory protein
MRYLYELMSPRETVLTGLKVYYGQLVLNWIWTPLFFGSKKVRIDMVANL